jgi:23S rRNA (guanine2445-N2)-methyltransferase / 23S rRNA (guanine2069-N7)-methyltransferase
MPNPLNFFAPCPKGLESLLADELRALGADNVKETRAGVGFTGDLVLGYRACLWSRLASRVVMALDRFPAATADELYQGVQRTRWSEHLDARGTLAVDFNGASDGITHSHFGALKVKDAIVDQLRDETGDRPTVEPDRPDLRINIFLYNNEATLSLDLSGESLHRRGYRREAVEAPLKENLAAAILLRANWPAMAASGGSLVDLMCGSGTLPIEAAFMAGDVAPGLGRQYFGFLFWKQHDHAAWNTLLAEARERREAGRGRIPPIRGYDHDKMAVRYARENVDAAGLSDQVVVVRRELSACAPEDVAPGLVVVNPPYGERLGETSELPGLYAELGNQLRGCFDGWRAAVFTGNPELGKHMGLRAERYHTLFNGAIECRLLHFDVSAASVVEERASRPFEIRPGSSAEMFANRLRKDLQHFGRWARRQDIPCYRLYDADLHEYNLAVDVYESGKRYVHVQEYEAPDTIDADKARQRLRHALGVIPVVLEIPKEQMFFKVRRRQSGGTQYEKQDETREFHEVREGSCKFWVNFTDYLDTGLFLDHRSTRGMLGELAAGKRFLNLFAYTATATVHAALGGAASTTSVDMSRTYLDWAQRNFDLNGIRGTEHELIQADVLRWLGEQRQWRYDLIFLDPPTFSRSKRMEDTLDIQRDHPALIQDAAALLAPGGLLVFSTNLRKFKLDTGALPGLVAEDITRKTIPKDFERNPKIHHCFRITRK